MGTQKNIMYRLLTPNHCYMGLNFRFQFLGPFWREMGMAARRRLWVWGLKTRPESWPTLGFFRVTFYLKIVFPNVQTLGPLNCVKVKGYALLKVKVMLNLRSS